jgi:hypothetical protein
VTAVPGPGRRRAFVAALAWFVALSPLLPFLFVTPRLGELPRNDYWGAFAQILDGERVSLDPARWFEALINEHRVAVPLALWTANAYASGGDDRVLRGATFLLLFAIAVLLLRELPLGVRSRPARFAAFGFLISAWLASPVGARTWAVGFIGTTWLLGSLLVVGAVVCFVRMLEVREGERWPRKHSLGLLGVGVTGLLTLATTLAVWPALCVGVAGFAEGKVRRRLGWIVGLLSALLLALFVLSYRKPEKHRPVEFQPGDWASFTTTLLGQPFSLESHAARACGAVGLAVLAAGIVWIARRPSGERRRFAVGLLVALAAAGSALETAIGRAGGAELTPLSSRYAPIPLLFWAGLTWTLGVFWWERSTSTPRALAAGWLVGLATLLPTLAVGRERLREELSLAGLQPLAALAVLWEVPDRVGLASVAVGLHQVTRSRDFFEKIGHKPFVDRSLWPLGARYEAPVLLPEAVNEAAEGLGRWNEFQEISIDFARVSGSLPEAAPSLERVLILSADGSLCGAGVPLELPPEETMRGKGSPRVRRALAFRHGRGEGGRAWSGYASRGCRPPVGVFAEFVPPVGWQRLRATDSVRDSARRWWTRSPGSTRSPDADSAAPEKASER